MVFVAFQSLCSFCLQEKRDTVKTQCVPRLESWAVSFGFLEPEASPKHQASVSPKSVFFNDAQERAFLLAANAAQSKVLCSQSPCETPLPTQSDQSPFTT